MGIQVYDPSGRRTRRVPSRPQQQAPPARTLPTADGADIWDRSVAGVSPDRPDEKKGLADSFFNTAVGGALGTVLNNKVVKSVLQPLDILGVPGRAIGSAIQEGADLIAGNGDASFGDFYNQTNPFFFAHGEDSGEEWRGLGDTWQQHGKALGAGNNRLIDAAVGFVGDVATDPLTYAGGIGVVDKGLDGLRAGSRLGAMVTRNADELKDVVGKVVAAEKRPGAREAIVAAGNPKNKSGSGTARSLTGRQTRYTRASEGVDLIERAVRSDGPALGKGFDPSEMLDLLYGESNIAAKAIEDIRYRAKHGLGAASPASSEKVTELVETALNIKGPKLRARVPLTGGRTMTELPGSGKIAERMQQGLAVPRTKFNETKLGSFLIDAKSPTDFENLNQVLSGRGSGGAEQFGQAARNNMTLERGRQITGPTSVRGQRMSRSRRQSVLDDMKAVGKEEYIRRIEDPNFRTDINDMLDEVVDAAVKDYGITVPRLGGSASRKELPGETPEQLQRRLAATDAARAAEGKIDYLPHMESPEMARWRRTPGGKATFETWVEKLGGDVEVDLLSESSFLKGRQLKADIELQVPGAPDGVTFNTGNGTVYEINKKAAEKMDKNGIKPFRILEDHPIKIFEDYNQAIAEDIGRRAARAEQIAQGSPDLAYDYANLSKQKQSEVLVEAKAAHERLGLPFDDAAVERIIKNPGVAKRKTQAEMAEKKRRYDAAVMNRKKSKQAEINLEYGDGSTVDSRTLELLDSDFEKWASVGENAIVVMDPRVHNMMKNVKAGIIEDPGMLMRVYRELNKYFKNFAVLTPGFHVRNGLSALYMNLADGVPLQTSYRGIREWSKFSKATRNTRTGQIDIDAGRKHLAGLRETPEGAKIADAIESVMGSGAGGRFTEAGLVEGGYGKVSRALTENRVTRKSQDAGAFVEGAARMGMALDVIESGGSMTDAVSRITRVQFDYSQTSRTDDTMKQIMPFWSFMSRNIPLQVMQQWSRPGAYQAYEHFKNNFGQPEVFEGREGEIPGYIEDGGGMPMNLGPLGNWFEPDLPHTRVAEDVERYMNVLNDPLGATSGVSPIITAPLEFGFKQDAFTGQRFEDDDLEHVSNPLEMLAVLPAWATKTLKMKDGEMFIEKRTLNALQAVDPLFSRASRLTGAGGQEKSRVIETIMRTGGLPVRNITPKQMENAARGARFDEADRRAVERAMERAVQGN